MAEFVIPPEYEGGFVGMRSLDEGQVGELVAALEDEPPTLNRAKLRSRVASKTDTIARSALEQIVETLVSLYALRDSMGLETAAFAGMICDAMDESGVEELRFEDDEEREIFRAR